MYTLVTGATSDIGRQICRTLEQAGHSLLLTDLSEEALKETVSGMVIPDRHKTLALDFSDVENAKKILKGYLVSDDVAVGYAVFAAGVFSVKPLRMIDYGFLKMNFDIALFSIFEIVQLLSSKKVNSDNLKSVVMISSVSAIMGTKGYCVYSAVKAAMIGLMKSMAAELSPKTRVNALLPGGIKTRTTSFLFESMGEGNPRYLLGNGTPSDIADMVNFLVSDKSRWITGQEFIVDGGLTCS